MNLLKLFSCKKKIKQVTVKAMVIEVLDNCFNTNIYNVGDVIEVVKSHGIGIYIRFYNGGRHDLIPIENIKILG